MVKFRKLGGEGGLTEEFFTSPKNRNHIYETMLLLSNYQPSNISISFKDIYAKTTTDTYIIPLSLRMHTRSIDPKSRLFQIESSPGMFFLHISYSKLSRLSFVHITPLKQDFFPTSYPVTEN